MSDVERKRRLDIESEYWRLVSSGVGTVEACKRRQQVLLHWLYTRHHDGTVRQWHLREILTQAEPWTVPFVVYLLGEYVVQIVQQIQRELIELDVAGTRIHSVYGQFATANPDLIALTYQRAASYWDCYYRNLYTDLVRYPGILAITAIRDAGRHLRCREGQR